MSMKAIQILTASVMIVIMAVNLAAVGFIIASQTTIMRLEFYDGNISKKPVLRANKAVAFQQGEHRTAQWTGGHSISGGGIN